MHTQARARVRLVSPAHCVRIVVKMDSSETDAIRRATASRRTPWTAIPLLDIATASQNGEVCQIYYSHSAVDASGITCASKSYDLINIILIK